MYYPQKIRSIDTYFKEISIYPVLSREEEVILCRSKEGRDELVKHNLKLVVHLIKGYVRPELQIDELILEGNLALIDASEKYDPSWGYRFESYASKAINNRILTRLKREKSKGRAYQKFESDMSSIEELQKNSDSLREIQQEEMQQILSSALHSRIISDKERKILELYYGLNGNEGTTKKEREIGEIFGGVCRQAISQSRGRSLERLRLWMRLNNLVNSDFY